jgi:hypothetical protein
MKVPSESFSTLGAALSWIAKLPGQVAELETAPALAVELDLLGRGDAEPEGEVVPFPRSRRAG